MGYGFCHNESDHIREGRDDYERRGYPDREKYSDHWNDCNRYYQKGYDEARGEEEREQERREEQRHEEMREEQRQRERAEMRRQEEDELYRQQEEDYDYRRQQAEIMEQEYGEPLPVSEKIQPTLTDDDLPF